MPSGCACFAAARIAPELVHSSSYRRRISLIASREGKRPRRRVRFAVGEMEASPRLEPEPETTSRKLSRRVTTGDAGLGCWDSDSLTDGAAAVSG
ncbi:hypothetical protein GN244_ATG14510 [Phytophthora infestans]|uniref:Uncharacterized protein n=1 Tax=Phytophthora infestans TaxID=4787 RepID=A0A833SW84_PHYIN|nr:hypothetical protein GN244_ATG14510 [Phytophthora infestans]